MVVWSASAQAHSGPGQILNAAVSPVPSVPPAPACELHIFPTDEIVDASPDYLSQTSSQTSVLGALVGGALTAIQTSGSGKLRSTALEQMRAYLKPETQVQELTAAGVVSVLKLPSDTRIVAEAALPAVYGDRPEDPAASRIYKGYWNAMKKGAPVQPSPAPCYRELIITNISIAKGLGSIKFSSGFVYRVFDGGHSETHLYDGENSLPKPDHFPAQQNDDQSETQAALRAAFTRNFTEWAGRRVKF